MRDNRRRRALDEGFTLVELLVVIVIVGLLAAIAIPIYLHQREKAYDASLETDVKTLATIEETVFVDHHTYLSGATAPERLADLRAVGWKASAEAVVEVAVDADRYCIRAHHPGATRDGGAGGFYWFDSTGGGLATTQPLGACADLDSWDLVS
ncbi:prepilin-type N-terminal cleavage/methylation domain-containing protein [Nocardioides mangrovi]|uniref:Prepilin-type N-terminal cleavage/methylation domain-containing protein n=1 Tax=Nocardioides mangrovi TaxID=2874580 RepID=A0ABS7UG54_9ACTN|nr:prepilin-type N-terminal cleavage/methylation domain-containing protein [Nocardioides mangrovi]MBZ5740019.1 prepilin-type N-terminal cleavage/methylation domain-containing protein [Nocardioides mangrovi]MBZ5740810.1 prepilin-type N-terminal cleavage/methylation domain-containing protein [Nocardioides mangrovi]